MFIQVFLGCLNLRTTADAVEAGLSIPLLKRLVNGLANNSRGIFMGIVALAITLCPAYALQLPGKNFVIKNPKVKWVVLEKQMRWGDITCQQGRMDNIVISGTFFDVYTGKVCYAKYTRNLKGFLGVTLIAGGDVYYHPRQQGYKTLDLNTFTERIAVGYTKEGNLIIGWGKMPLLLMAYYMKSVGCVEAVGLDGGSSAGIFIKGMTMQTPGRKLTNVYVIGETK